MEIKKETKIIPMTSDGEVLNIGDTVVFNAAGRCFTGKYIGISKKGAVMIKGIIFGAEVEFNVMPRTIAEIVKVEGEEQWQNRKMK